jgi:hypothetical protein
MVVLARSFFLLRRRAGCLTRAAAAFAASLS